MKLDTSVDLTPSTSPTAGANNYCYWNGEDGVDGHNDTCKNFKTNANGGPITAHVAVSGACCVLPSSG